MPRVAPMITSFNGGEWSPLLYGRTDLQKYASACRALENFLPLAQGPVVRRPGTRFVAETKEFVCSLATFDLREAVVATSSTLPRGDSEMDFARLAAASGLIRVLPRGASIVLNTGKRSAAKRG